MKERFQRRENGVALGALRFSSPVLESGLALCLCGCARLAEMLEGALREVERFAKDANLELPKLEASPKWPSDELLELGSSPINLAVELPRLDVPQKKRSDEHRKLSFS